MGAGLGVEVNLDDDDDVEQIRKQLVPQLQLIDVGLETINNPHALLVVLFRV